MGYKIYESIVDVDTIRINGSNAFCIAEFVSKPSRKSTEKRRLFVKAEFAVERGVFLYRNEIKILEESGIKINYSVTDDEFKEMVLFASHKDKIPSVSTILQQELYCVAVTEAGIHPGINNDPTITVKGSTASCYSYFDFDDKSQLSMSCRYTEDGGFMLDTTDSFHIDVNMNSTLREKEFEANFEDKMYYNLFYYAALRAGIESRLRYALTAANSTTELPEKVEIQTVNKGPVKKEKGVNRYR